MSRETAVLAELPPAAAEERAGFRCFCGRWFPDRAAFDVHFADARHPGRFSECADCGRVLPKCSWRVDGSGTYECVDEPLEWRHVRDLGEGKQ